MVYNPSDRSELELRFEKLFQETFGCPVEDILTPQYPLEVNDRFYRIDYAFVTDHESIAFELDGHGKIRNASDSSQAMNDLFTRQNDIVDAGFKVYRFTWKDVVSQGGWKCRQQLKKVLKDRFSQKRNQSFQNAPMGESEDGQMLASVKIIHPSDPAPSKAQTSSSTTATIAKTKTVNLGRKQKLALIIFAVVAFNFGSLLWSSRKDEPVTTIRPASTRTQPSQLEPIQAATSTTQAPTRPKPDTLKVVYIPVQSRVTKKEAPIKAVKAAPIPTRDSKPILRAEQAPSSPNPEPVVETTEATTSPASVDEIVVFNQRSLIFHQPHCYWAMRCTKNCIYIPKSQALEFGGRAAKSCNPQ